MIGRDSRRLRLRLAAVVLLALLPAAGLLLYGALEQRRSAVTRIVSDARWLARLASVVHERAVDGARRLLPELARSAEVREGNAHACRRFLAGVLARNSAYANLGAAAVDGDIFCSAVQGTNAPSMVGSPWFQRALERRELSLGDYREEPMTGEIALTLGQPAFDDRGRVTAVVFAALRIDWLDELTDEPGFPSGSSVLLINARGRILGRYPDAAKWVGKSAATAPVVRAILTDGEGVAQAQGVDGLTRLFGFAPLEASARGQRVYLGLGIPSEVALGAVDVIWRRSLLGLLLVTVLGGAVAWIGGEALLLRRLRATGEATKRLLDRHGLGVFRTLRDGRLLASNDAFAEVLGYTASEELRERRVAEHFVEPAEWDRLVAGLRLAGAFTGLDVRLRRRDGTPVSVLMSLVREEAGPDGCLEGIVTDITERKRSETELRGTQALRSVSNLGRAAAHEINNALTPLVGHLQLLDRKMAEDPGARQRLAAALKAAERIHETVARMARITRLELASGPGDLHEMLDLTRSAGDPEQPANGQDRSDGAGGA